MKNIEMKQHILTIYLAIILLIQMPTTVQTIFLAIIPLTVVSVAIHMNNRNLGILGLFLFYLVSLSQVWIITMEDILALTFEFFFLLIPSLILISQILQLENKELILLSRETKKKPLLIAASLIIFITAAFYLIAILLWDGFLLSPENIEGQILLLIAISVTLTTPLLLK